MSERRQQAGRAGEELAAEYLKSQGFKIVDRNYRCRLGEIDIIAEENGVTVFIEVRSRTGISCGNPEESVTYKKGLTLKKLAKRYMQQKYGREVASRIDLVAVMLNSDVLSLRNLTHYRGILSG